MTAVIESPAPPGRHRDTGTDAGAQLMLETLQRVEARVALITKSRDEALERARVAEAERDKMRRARDDMFATNLELQRELDRTEASTVFRINRLLLEHLGEYNHVDRPAYEATIADLRAQVTRLLEQAAAIEALHATPAPRRRGRRH